MIIAFEGTDVYQLSSHLGTSQPNEPKTDGVFKGSFAWQMGHIAPPFSRYVQGPDVSGALVEAQVAAGWRHIRHMSGNGTPKNVMLAGYSRGGTAAIELARQHPEIEIEALFLFDAVDRQYTIDSSTIPHNVRRAYHAIRDPKINSRPWFGNAGTKTSGGHMETQLFAATHAALGGMPWTGPEPARYVVTRDGDESTLEMLWKIATQAELKPTLTKEQDIQGSQAVAAWMNTKLQQHGIPIPLMVQPNYR